ncbi:secretin and TonB N-terminal domain-containing protein [Desulfobacter postgatei]|uniref:type IV pilus secretin PilQ n=1 Tax=Desulfobacter postgatei TaxID=2293 RepID=UPI002A35AE3E|nr:secretin and TonB N-terminal domain-containing protein [Desulfobacter postgatei]MDX9962702.1 secretin and TonB N-terminal domain-containing protein [Desulfobacter postgatei]
MIINYRSALRRYMTGLIMSVLMLSFTAGCVTQKTGVAASTAKVEESPISHDDSGSLPKTVNKIWVNPKADAFEVWIQASGPLNDYTSIKQSFPFAVSVYLSNVHLARGLVDAGYFSDSRVSDITVGFIDKAQTTVKVDILLKADLPYIVEEKPDRLGIIIKGSQSLSEQSAKAGSISDESGQGWKDVVEPSKDVSIPGTAHLTHIEFDSNNLGESDVQILTDHPVRYETVQTRNGSLGLILYNTTVPLHHQRPLLSRYFNSAVEQVMPGPNPANPNDTLVDIKIREKVPFQVVQTTKGIHVIFQAPNVSAPEFDQVKVSSDAGKNTHPGLKKYDQGESTTQAKRLSPDQDPLLNPSSVRYTGEKIKLDFYETDIKNVFRILKSVAGVNFAIDRDVQGKVTLTLQDPVPWDQILDLILKMNNLGKKMEGNVIRIATTETLAREETQRQEAIAARQKSEEQEKALEPLVTEYIPVNYSDAKKDIEPHVSKILTPNRGKISVDARTNQLIITDTQAKIDQAFELINRLDTVTPQIMIEAKVVEVTKEFSRSFGINWNLSNASDTTSGFVDDFSVSVNKSGVSGDFSFFGLFGSSVSALNAKLAASEEQGDVRIVSSPRILTLDNKKAMIKQGQQYAYQEVNAEGTAGVAFKDIDLLLEVTPHVTPDNRISMNVRLTKNDVGPENTLGAPSLVTNEAETELLVNNNDTVVIGGVIKSTQSQDTDGAPFLTNLPGLGYLFGTKAKVDNRNELLIFLTPSIVQLEQKRHIVQ